MKTKNFKKRWLAQERMVGCFLNTPAVGLVEVLAQSGLDFICLDAEHGPFDRAALNACLAVSRGRDFPTLVRVQAARPEYILQALDAGAVGVVVPHVMDVQTAQMVAKTAHFGHLGRGYHGGTRWAGFGGDTMAGLLGRSAEETLVITQIEEPEAVDVCDEIAAVPGVDALFVGPSDLSVGYGKQDLNSDELRAAYARVGEATKAASKSFVTYVTSVDKAVDTDKYGVNVYVVGSELALIARGAKQVASALGS